MKPIILCLVLSALLLSAQGLDLSFGLRKRSPDPLPPAQVIRLFGFPTHGTSLIQVGHRSRPFLCLFADMSAVLPAPFAVIPVGLPLDWLHQTQLSNRKISWSQT